MNKNLIILIVVVVVLIVAVAIGVYFWQKKKKEQEQIQQQKQAEEELAAKTKTVTIMENETLSIPADATIVSAVYGADKAKAVDVKSRLAAAQRSGVVTSLKVTNETMGGDPEPGVQKKITVDYIEKDESKDTE